MLSGTLDRTIIDSCDVLFAPMASECIFRLRTDKPLIYLSDATFAIMVDYYFHNLSKRTVRQGNMIERNAIDLASEVVVSHPVGLRNPWLRTTIRILRRFT